MKDDERIMKKFGKNSIIFIDAEKKMSYRLNQLDSLTNVIIEIHGSIRQDDKISIIEDGKKVSLIIQSSFNKYVISGQAVDDKERAKMHSMIRDMGYLHCRCCGWRNPDK